MSDASIVIEVKSQGNGAKVIKRDLDDIDKSGDKATKQVDRINKSFVSLDKVSRSLKGGLTGIVGTLGVRAFAKAADEIKLLEARIQNATRTTKEFNTAYKGLNDAAALTGASLSSSIDVFQRLSFVRTEIDATVEEMVNFTASVQKLGVVSGATTTALNAGLTQLGQGLSAGVLRAEEFNSVVENIPLVAVQIAKEFGVSTGELRKLVLAGEVLSEDVFAAILNQTEEIDRQFKAFPRTIGQAFNNLILRTKQAIGEFDNLSNTSSIFIGSLEIIGKAIQGLVGLIVGFGNVAKAVFSVVAGVITASFIDAAKLIQQTINIAIKGINLLKKDDIALLDFVPNIDPAKIAMEGYADAVEKARLAGEGFKGAFESTLDIAGLTGEQDKLSNSTRELTKDYSKLAKSLGDTDKSSKKAKQALKEQNEIQRDLNRVVQDNLTDLEKYNQTVRELERLRGFAKTAKEVEGIERALKAARKELDQIRIDAELDSPLGKAFKSLAGEIEDDFKEAFKEGFGEADGGFKSLIEGWKNTFKNFLAELSYQALAKPIIVSVLGGVAGSVGLSSGASAQALGGSSGIGSLLGGGGSGGLGNIGSIFNAGRSLLGGSLAGTFDSVGSFFGIGNSLQGPTLSGGTLGGLSQYSTLTNGSFGGSIGGLAGGFAGNFGANALFGGDRGIGANIGGTIGGIAGSFIPVPILGPAIGSFIGNAIGGLFGGGGKPSDKAQASLFDLSTLTTSTEGAGGSKFSQENADLAGAITGQAAAVAQALKSFGAEFNPGVFNVTAGSRDGLRVNNVLQSSVGSAVELVNTVVVNSLKGAPDILTNALAKTSKADTQGLIDTINVVGLIQSFEDVADSTFPLKENLEALDDQFKSLADKAVSLGLPVDKLTESYDKQRKALLDGIFKPFQDFLDGQALSSSSTLSPIDRLGLARSAFDTNLSAIKSGDISGINNITKQANNLLGIGRNVFASGEGFSSLEAYVRQSIVGIADDLGAGGIVTDSISREVVLSNAQQTSILEQVLLELQQVREENTKLRKSMERVGNSLVIQE